MRRINLADASHEFSDGDLKSVGNLLEILEADITPPDFNARVVGTIHFNQIGELLLAAPESSAELFASHAE